MPVFVTCKFFFHSAKESCRTEPGKEATECTQGFIRDFSVGGGENELLKTVSPRGVWGHAPPRYF